MKNKGKDEKGSRHNTILSDLSDNKLRKIFVGRDFLKKEYIKEGRSCQEIALLVGNVSRQGIWKAIKRYGLKTRSKEDAIFYENGNRCKLSQGYFWIYLPSHPRNNNGYIKRATLNLEEKIGRLLLPGELAHHKDENRLNDNIDNLELSNRSKHRIIHSLLNNCR